MATTPTPNWQQFSDNITGANGGAGSDIYKNYAIGKVGLDETGAQYSGNEANAQANIDSINQANAQAAAKLTAQKAQDASDPSKAQMVLLPNAGGYAFYDGTGKRININQYSLLTGKTPAQLLGDSPNPSDQKFVQDYNTLQALSTAWVNGDTKTLAKFRAADPQKFNQLISTYKSPAQMVQAFTQHWSNYYGQGAPDDEFSAKSNFSPQPLQNPDAATSKALASTPLSAVLTPQPTLQKPSYSIGGSILSKIPGTAEHAAVGNYNAAENANPWFTYNNSLYGS